MTEYEALAYEIGVRQNINNITEEGWNIIVELLLKQVPKTPLKYKNSEKYDVWLTHWRKCPNCGENVSGPLLSDGDKFCRNCGQAIDWSKE